MIFQSQIYCRCMSQCSNTNALWAVWQTVSWTAHCGFRRVSPLAVPQVCKTLLIKYWLQYIGYNHSNAPESVHYTHHPTHPSIFQHQFEFSQEEILPDYSISISVEGQYFFGHGDPSVCFIWPVVEGKQKTWRWCSKSSCMPLHPSRLKHDCGSCQNAPKIKSSLTLFYHSDFSLNSK